MFKLLIFLAILGAGAFALSTHFSNRFNTLKDRIADARRRLGAALEARLNVLKRLDSQLSGNDNIGRSAVSSSLRLSEKAVESDSLTEIGMLIEEVNDHLERAAMQLRNPNLTNNSTALLPTLDQIEESSRSLKLAQSEYNSMTDEYNQMTEKGPSSMVAKVMKFEQIQPCLGPDQRRIGD